MFGDIGSKSEPFKTVSLYHLLYKLWAEKCIDELDIPTTLVR